MLSVVKMGRAWTPFFFCFDFTRLPKLTCLSLHNVAKVTAIESTIWLLNRWGKLPHTASCKRACVFVVKYWGKFWQTEAPFTFPVSMCNATNTNTFVQNVSLELVCLQPWSALLHWQPSSEFRTGESPSYTLTDPWLGQTSFWAWAIPSSEPAISHVDIK